MNLNLHVKFPSTLVAQFKLTS